MGLIAIFHYQIVMQTLHRFFLAHLNDMPLSEMQKNPVKGVDPLVCDILLFVHYFLDA